MSEGLQEKGGKRAPMSAAERMRKWRAAHPEKAAAAVRQYQRENLPAILAYQKRWRADRKRKEEEAFAAVVETLQRAQIEG
jgi:hypothetical protein